MNAKDLAPSLFATATLIESAAKSAMANKGKVVVHVQADFRRGSFEYGLVAAAVMAVGHQLFANLSISDLGTLLQWIGFKGKSSRSLFGILKQAGDKPIERIEKEPGGNITVIFAGDNAKITVTNVEPEVVKFLSDPEIRNQIPDIVAPVEKDGIDEYFAGIDGKRSVVVGKGDLLRMQRPTFLRDELADATSETAVELLAPSFVDGNKWRVSQGGDAYWARVLDESFLASVERGERGFHKGDYLIVRLRTRAYATPDGLQVERDIVEVLDHKQRGPQIKLL